MNIIFFDYHHQNKNVNADVNFGQITICNDEGEKIIVINLDKLNEDEFKEIYEKFKEYGSNIETKYWRIKK